MTIIRNGTRRPLSVPLPRGKKLHLSPGKTGQIAETAVEHPAVKKLIEAGEIEVVGDDAANAGFLGGGGGSGPRPHAPAGRTPAGTGRNSGDR